MSKWEMVELGEVCEILDSMRVPITASDRTSGIFPYYGANGVQDYISEYIFDDELVLLAEDGGNFGSKTRPIAYRVSGKCWVNNHAHVLKPKPVLNVDYLCYSIMFYDVSNIISGTTRAKLNQAAMRRMTIPLPPLETQTQIAQTLDAASELLAMRKQQLAELDSLIKSTFYDMFGDPVTNEKGWEIKTLQELINEGYITSHLDGNHGSLYPKSSEFVDHGIPYIGANCIENNKTNFSKAKYLSRERASKFKKGVSKDGDVLFAHNATVGPVAILETPEEYVVLSTSLTYYRCNRNLLNNYYLMCFMKSSFFVRQYISNMGQTTRNQVPITAQKRFLHMVPPMELQTQFATIVTKIEEKKVLVKKAIDETQYLLDSLMSEYFE